MSCVHIYCGGGKGKTTAALGLGLRMCGSGGHVLLAQFLKASVSSELAALAQVKGFSLLQGPDSVKFTFQMSEEEKAEAARFWQDFFRRAVRQAEQGPCDLLLLDELVGAVALGMVPEEEVCAFLRSRPQGLEVVLTGRDPSPALLELADYVSEIQAVKHPYEKGVPARRGVEF